MRKILLVMAVVGLAVVASMPLAAADSGSGNSGHVVQRQRTEGDIVIIEVEGVYRGNGQGNAANGNGGSEEPDISPQLAYYGSSGGCGWTFYNSMSYTVDETLVNSYYAYSKRNSGTCSYKTDVHASLVEQNGAIWDVYWSGLNYPCMKETKVNAIADTCASPWESISAGDKWGAWAGLKFDVGNNGSWEGNCAGCIDITVQF